MKYIKRKFLPKKLGFGLALIAIGMVVTVSFYTIIPVMPLILLIGAMASVPIGVLIALSSFGKVCTNCQEVLVTKVVEISGKLKTDLKSAFKSGSTSEIYQLYLQKQKPSLNDLQLKCVHCPKCKEVALLSVAGWGKIEVKGCEIKDIVA